MQLTALFVILFFKITSAGASPYLAETFICQSHTHYIVRDNPGKDVTLFKLNKDKKSQEVAYVAAEAQGQLIEINCFKDQLVFMYSESSKEKKRVHFYHLKENRLVEVIQSPSGQSDFAGLWGHKIFSTNWSLWVERHTKSYYTKDFKKWESVSYEYLIQSGDLIMGPFCDSDYMLHLKFHSKVGVESYAFNEKCPPGGWHEIQYFVPFKDSYFVTFARTPGDEIPRTYSTYKINKKTKRIEKLSKVLGEEVFHFKNQLLRVENEELQYSENAGDTWTTGLKIPKSIYGGSEFHSSASKAVLKHGDKIFESKDGKRWELVVNLRLNDFSVQ